MWPQNERIKRPCLLPAFISNTGKGFVPCQTSFWVKRWLPEGEGAVSRTWIIFLLEIERSQALESPCLSEAAMGLLGRQAMIVFARFDFETLLDL